MTLAIEQVLYKELLASSGVGAVVGTRVYPVMAPQQVVAPFVVYESEGNVYQGLQGSTGLAWARIEYACHGSTYASSRQVGAAVLLALNHRWGVMQGVRVGSVLSENMYDAGWDDTTKTYVHVVSLRVQYEE